MSIMRVAIFFYEKEKENRVAILVMKTVARRFNHSPSSYILLSSFMDITVICLNSIINT